MKKGIVIFMKFGSLYPTASKGIDFFWIRASNRHVKSFSKKRRGCQFVY